MPDSTPFEHSSSNKPYRGRFAPSPSGPLHLGSLVAALASYLDARHNSGSWLVRIDDLDPPREVPGAATDILDSLAQHCLHWDEEILWQSQRNKAYQQALDKLDASGLTFSCDCTRAMLGSGGSCIRGCAQRQERVTKPAATRIVVEPGYVVTFNDHLQGPQTIELGQLGDNFLIHRRDGLYAYQLAVVVDDAYQGFTHIVRGSDLLDTTARQVFLQQKLGHSTPSYCHIPVISDADGNKFSKHNHAPALNNSRAPANLRVALQFLGQRRPPQTLLSAQKILDFAQHHWSLENVPRVMSRAYPTQSGGT